MKDLLNIFRDTRPKIQPHTKHTVMEMLRTRLDLSTHDSRVRLRFGREDDFAVIMDLQRRGYQGYEAWRLHDFQHDWRRNPHGVYLVLEESEGPHPKMVAFIVGRFRSRGSHISHIIVDPDLQGKSYGKLLMQKWVECAKILRTPKISLEVRQSNYRAQQLYQGFGFEKRHIKPYYYSNNNEDGVEMICDLRRI